MGGRLIKGACTSPLFVWPGISGLERMHSRVAHYSAFSRVSHRSGFDRAGFGPPYFFRESVIRKKSEPPVGVPAARAWGWRALLKFEEEATITNRANCHSEATQRR